MNRAGRWPLSLCLAAALASCSGGGSPTSNAPTPTPTPPPGGTPTPTPPPTTGACSLSNRQDFAFDTLDEWYLFPNLLATNVNKANYSDLQSYIDALVAPARAQGRDRFFTYVTSIQEEEDLINSGATAGFGFRLMYFNDGGNLRVFVSDSLEGAPALGQNIDRGDELLGVSTQGGTMLLVNSLPATSGGVSTLINALGPDTPGTTRVLRIQYLGGAQMDVTLAKADFNIQPVSPRFGVETFNNNGTTVGYVNLRTFASLTGSSQLRDAFQTFKNQGITQVIVDLRYNGGGLVSVAELFGDLMLANRVGQVFSYTTLRSSKSSLNETDNIGSQSQAIAATKIAFIGTGSTASASELVINAIPPYLGNNVALIGENTYGKPVGQFAFDLDACDDRLRVVAFRTENADNEGDYYNGLATTMPRTCQAIDDIFTPMGSASEDMIATALDWLRTGTCTAISGGLKTTQGVSGSGLLQPERPTTVQREVPGLF
ncbi:MAG TPA: S41 family peptidase [Sphingomonadaceae bacterium]|nr:S41 family peptidase [Sphingomonadaceae bacterium]